MSFVDALAQRARIMRTDIVEGEPISVGEKELAPLAKVTSFTRDMGEGESKGRVSFATIKPVAVLERNPGEATRFIPIRDTTGEIVRVFWVVGLLTLTFSAAFRMIRSRRSLK
jgi:hypothetical protein